MRLLSHTILLSLLAHILFSDDNQTSQPLLLHCSPLYTSPVIPTVNLTVQSDGVNLTVQSVVQSIVRLTPFSISLHREQLDLNRLVLNI